MVEASKTNRTRIPKWIRLARPPKPTGNFVGVGGPKIDQDIRDELMMLLMT